MARIIKAVTGAIAAVIVVGILLVVFEANPRNDAVEFVLDVGRFFVGPLKSVFDLDDAKAQIALNWGIAALLWAAGGALVARLLAGASGGGGRRGFRRDRSAV
ncbi:MAG: hypothetical protein H0V29_03695 [Thermoleophilaceae bacterium]|nr:hypothetical protein [Thermoleophilaceae bacterium]